MKPCRTWLVVMGALALLAGCLAGDPAENEYDEPGEMESSWEAAANAAPDRGEDVQAADSKASGDGDKSLPYPPCSRFDGRECRPGTVPLICLLGPGEIAMCFCEDSHFNCW